MHCTKMYGFYPHWISAKMYTYIYLFFLKTNVRMGDYIFSIGCLVTWHCPLLMTSPRWHLMSIFYPMGTSFCFLTFALDFLCYLFRKTGSVCLALLDKSKAFKFGDSSMVLIFNSERFFPPL